MRAPNKVVSSDRLGVNKDTLTPMLFYRRKSIGFVNHGKATLSDFIRIHKNSITASFYYNKANITEDIYHPTNENERGITIAMKNI